MPTECPNCEKLFKGKKCGLCGWTPEPVATPRGPYDPNCTATTNGLRCGLLGVFQATYRNPLRCEWHSLPDSGGRAKDSYDEFERWVLIQRRHYCGQFSHIPVSGLWATVRGEAPLPFSRTMCDQPSCRVVSIETHTLPKGQTIKGLIRQALHTLDETTIKVRASSGGPQ